MRRTVVIAGTALAALVLLTAALLAFHNPLAALVIRSVAAGMGYSVAFDKLDVGLSGAIASGTKVTNRSGEPVFDAPRIEVHYSIRYVLPGSNRRRFGISALDIQRPTVTLIHHADGTYNVALPKNASSAKPDTTPVDLQIRVRDGSIVFLDRYVVPGRERRQRIVGLAADAVLAPHAHSYYKVKFDLDDGHTLHPVIGKATFAADRGYEAQRWTAADLPIGPLVNFVLPSHAIDVVDGDLRNVDGRIYAFVDPDGTTHPFASLRTELANGKVYVSGIEKPLRDAHGTVLAYDNGLTTTSLDATLAGVPLRAAGGIYDFGAPKIEVALTGRGEIAQLQQAIAPPQRQPLTGGVTFAMRALGNLNSPVVSGTFSAPQIVYRGFPFRNPGGTFSVHGSNLDVLGVHLDYGPINVEAHGTLALEKQVGTNLVVTLHGDGDKLPYVPQLLRGLPVTAVVHVEGVGTKLASAGVLYGDAHDGSLDAMFDVDGGGSGVIGPLSIVRNDGTSLYARVAIDRTKSTALGIVDARRLSLLPVTRMATLPGVHTAALPLISGTLDAQLVGGLDNDRLDALSGHLRLAGLRYGAIAGSATADLNTASDGTQRGDVRVTTSLGTLDGTAAYADGLAAFDGTLHASFAQLQPLTGNLGARGTIEGPLLALSDGASSAVQTSALRFIGASVHGIPLRDARATATLHGNVLDVRALQLHIAGGTVTMRGGLGNGDRDELVATTTRLDLRALAGHAAPLTAGALMANAHVRGALNAPSANIAVLVDGARTHNLAVSANAFAHYERGTLHVNDATVLMLDSYATAAGDIRNLNGGTPALDLTANLHGAQVAPIAKALHLPLRYPDGEIDANLHATGIASAPHVDGTVSIPRGSLNGLNFSAANLAVSGGTGGIAARNGTVTIGTTKIAFSGDAGPGAQQFRVSAPRVDLADFDDYFDTADTLAGKGHVFVNAQRSAGRISADGNVQIDDARYRRYSIGAIAAAFQTTGRTIATTASVTSDHGTATLSGDVILPASDQLRNTARRTTLALTGTIASFDLAQWLPTAGITIPVAGTVDGSAHVTGALAAPSFDANAALANGAVQGYHLTSVTLAANGDARSAHLTAFHVAGPALNADASGTLGYGAHDPIAIALHAQSDDIALLAKSFGAKADVSGSFTTTLDAGGTRSAPRLTQTLDATNLRYAKYTLPRLHADLAADPRTVQLRALEADLAQGKLFATATLPIRLTGPPGLRNDAFAATLRADDIEFAQFAPLLPFNSRLAGRIDGQINASGTQSAPVLAGTLTLANGSYSSSLVRSPVTNIRARLDLARSEARLTGLHADVGGGAFDGAANATYGDLRDVQRTLAVNGQIVANNATINIANLFSGTINGTLAATKPQGAIPTLAGTLAFSKTRIPLAALIPRSSAPTEQRVPRTVNFDLNVQAANDVRVQGPGIDIGARGAVALTGNLARPQLSGRVTSTDGTLSFYRTFVLRQAAVQFSPAAGLIPDIDATATTHITNPSADILLHVTGPATNLNLDLASNPSYDKEQILGLLVNAQAFGAVPGVETAQSGTGINAGSIAGSFLANEFTQNLLQPVGSQLGQALGFDNLALGYDFGAGFSAGARKQLGKNLYASFNQTFGGDQRQAISLTHDLPRNASIALTAFNAGNQTPTVLITQQLFAPVGPTNFTLQALQPPPGVSGIVLNYQRRF